MECVARAGPTFTLPVKCSVHSMLTSGYDGGVARSRGTLREYEFPRVRFEPRDTLTAHSGWGPGACVWHLAVALFFVLVPCVARRLADTTQSSELFSSGDHLSWFQNRDLISPFAETERNQRR